MKHVTRMRLGALPIAIAGLLNTFAASADTVAPGAEGELARFLPPVVGKRVCFARIYEADHWPSIPSRRSRR